MTNDWPFGVATAINDHLQNLGFTTSLTHHDTTGGKSSYLGIADPQTGRYLNKIRMSDHSTGPIRASQETHINKPEDVRKIIDWANDLRAQGPTQYWKDKKALEDAGLGHLTGSRREKAITRLRQPLIAPISKQDGGMTDDPEKAVRQAMTVARGVTPDERQANFKRWFGNSKAVDPKGNPLVLYHGTQNNFNQFRPHGIGTTTFIGIPTKVERHGIFMSPHPEFASSFAQQGSNQTGANVMPLHVRMENPLKMDRNGLHPDDVQNLASHGINEKWLNNSAGDPRSTWEAFEGQDAGWFIKTIQDAGYDGVHMEEEDPATGKIHPVYVAFHPTQIKSAIGNQGTYNLNDPDINKASGGMTDDPAKKALAIARDATGKNNLPMDQKSRLKRARAMGFDTKKVYYHGTDQDIKQFDPVSPQGHFGVYISKDPMIADVYATKNQYNEPPTYGANIMPLYAKKNAPIKTNQMAGYYKVNHPSELRSIHANFDPNEINNLDIMKSNGGMIDNPDKAIRRATMVAKGLAKEIGPLPTVSRPAAPHPASMIPGVHVTGMGDEHTAIPDGYADGGDVEPNTDQPTHNHVIFDPSIIDIKHRYARGGAVDDLARRLTTHRNVLSGMDHKAQYAAIDGIMRDVSEHHDIMPNKLHDGWVARHRQTPDDWINSNVRKMPGFHDQEQNPQKWGYKNGGNAVTHALSIARNAIKR